jgi:uncharacterized membrane protein
MPLLCSKSQPAIKQIELSPRWLKAVVAQLEIRPVPIAKSLSPDTFEKILSVGAVLLLVTAITAVLKGSASWDQIPVLVWLHLATIFVALALTPIMLLRTRGDRPHRRLGWIWVSAMFMTAALTFGIRISRDGGFSVIHILSLWVVIQVPIIVWHAKNHRIEKHRAKVRGMVLGALLIAGFFTFPFGRLMGQWLFS